MNKDKIYLIGSGMSGMTSLRVAEAMEKLDRAFDVEIVSHERAIEMGIPQRPEPITVPIINFNETIPQYYQPPLTRAQRRAKERKNKKK